jgi:hypothetical protein
MKHLLACLMIAFVAGMMLWNSCGNKTAPAAPPPAAGINVDAAD